MLYFALLMILPVAIALFSIYKFKGEVTGKEFALQLAVPAVIVALGFLAAYEGKVLDHEVWNGQITSRQRVKVSCEHSYSCNCSTDSKGHETCQTCYEHSYDVDWRVYSSTGEHVNISRVDRQGLIEPKRWDAAYIGEPYSSTHTFTNYLLLNPNNVLLGSKGDMERYGKLIPNYPGNVYDYYRHTPVINIGVPDLDMKTWSWLVGEVNKTLGPVKQVNVILLFVGGDVGSDYMQALKDKWIGGKKNDVIVVINSKDGHIIKWADVMSWSSNGDLQPMLRGQIEDIGTLDKRDDIVKAIHDDVATKFVRMHMKDYQYLMRSYEPSGTALLICFLVSLAASIGLAVWAINNSIITNEPIRKWRRIYE